MAEILGTSAADDLQGTPDADIIRAGAGNDIVRALGGADEVYGEADDDYLDGGEGDDRLYGGTGRDSLFGGLGGDTIRGDDGDDTIQGGAGDDDLAGGAGNDLIEGDGVLSAVGDGDDLIDGGDGDDRLFGRGGADTLRGGVGADQLSGGAGADQLFGDDGNDILDGFGEDNGSDTAVDTLSGGAGDDRLIVGLGDSADGGADYDELMVRFTAGATAGVTADFRQLANGGTMTLAGATLQGIERVSEITLTAFDDDVIAGPGREATGVTVNGGAGNDRLTGSDLADIISGGEGNDTIRGGFDAQAAGNDQLFGDAGDDTIYTVGRASRADGGSGADRLFGGDGDDVLQGGTGDDVLEGGGGSNQLTGGEGADRFVYAGHGYNDYISDLGAGDRIDLSGLNIASFAALQPFLENYESYHQLAGNTRIQFVLNGAVDTILIGARRPYTLSASDFVFNTSSAPLTVTGTDNRDLLFGGNGNDVLTGGGGDDLLLGGAGADRIDGGAGSDTATYHDSVGGVSVNLAAQTANGGYAQGDTLIGIENLRGSDEADVLVGDANANILEGGAGRDVLSGGAGVDVLTGGLGSDDFHDTAARLNGDTITDLGAGDRITIADAALDGFSFALEGYTLRFTGGSVTLSTLPSGPLAARAAAGGGVELILSSAPPPADAPVRHDFDGDGRSDILWRNTDGTLSDWLGRGDGSFEVNDANALARVSPDWSVAGIVDVDGDGRSDILWRNADGRFSDWLGGASGGFAPNDANALRSVGLDWSIVGTGDFNGDGRGDVLWRQTYVLSDWLGQANGSFVENDAAARTRVDPDWQVAGTGDFNGDGRDDILWRNNDGRLSDWLGQTNGGFIDNDAVALTALTPDWKVAGTGDFNGDGRADIVWRNDDGRVSDWLGSGSGSFVANDANALASVPTSWQIVSTGDYNGDGFDDLLWRNDDGRLSDWLGTATGGFTVNDANALASAPTSWHVQPEPFAFG